MKRLLEKLDRKTKSWLEAVDDQLHEPILRAMTGEVFIHRVRGSNGLGPGLTESGEPKTIRIGEGDDLRFGNGTRERSIYDGI